MKVSLNGHKRRVLTTVLIHAALLDASVADLFRGLDLSADDLLLTDRQSDVIRGAMSWARNEFVSAARSLDEMEAARAEIEGELLSHAEARSS